MTGGEVEEDDELRRGQRPLQVLQRRAERGGEVPLHLEDRLEVVIAPPEARQSDEPRIRNGVLLAVRQSDEDTPGSH